MFSLTEKSRKATDETLGLLDFIKIQLFLSCPPKFRESRTKRETQRFSS